MNVYFEIESVSGCSIRIKDTTQLYKEYLSETSNTYIRLGKFKYTDCYTVNIISYRSSTNTKVLNTIITPHTSDGLTMHLDEVYYNLDQDGYYIIDHILVPSIQWYEKLVSEYNSTLNEYVSIYLSDGQKLYKVKDGKYEEVKSLEIREVNTEYSTISRTSQSFFSTCYLHNCYIQHCNDIFGTMFNKCHTPQINSFNRDFVWMALNIINYYVECNLLNKAQKLLEEIYGCGNVCKHPKSSTKSKCSCCN